MEQKFIQRYNDLVKLDQLKGFTKQMKQQRGRDFEDLINDIFEDEKILLNKSYHTSDNSSEQIDGAISLENRVFLIEVKWVKSPLAASELYSFIGKIDNKFFGTLGIFISRLKLSENFINSLNKGRKQTVIVIHGEDIDDLFSNHNAKISDYISHVVKLMSYDNKTHFSFKNYLSIKTPQQTFITKTTDTNVDDFIENKLITGLLSEELLILKLEKLTIDQKEKIYEFVIEKYGKYWKIGFTNFNFNITRNFDLFLKHFTPDHKFKEKLASKFYEILVFENIEIYHRDSFNGVFSPIYHSISEKIKSNFELEIARLLRRYNSESNWNGENYVTEIISPILSALKPETIENLKDIYLRIYIRDTLEKFSQKKFANMLVEKNIIDEKFTKDWLEKEIQEFIKSNGNEKAIENINFFARTYYKLNNILRIRENWRDYIDSRIKNIS